MLIAQNKNMFLGSEAAELWNKAGQPFPSLTFFNLFLTFIC